VQDQGNPPAPSFPQTVGSGFLATHILLTPQTAHVVLLQSVSALQDKRYPPILPQPAVIGVLATQNFVDEHTKQELLQSAVVWHCPVV
jgi:H+/gluconate symporter-like permease